MFPATQTRWGNCQQYQTVFSWAAELKKLDFLEYCPITIFSVFLYSWNNHTFLSPFRLYLCKTPPCSYLNVDWRRFPPFPKLGSMFQTETCNCWPCCSFSSFMFLSWLSLSTQLLSSTKHIDRVLELYI